MTDTNIVLSQIEEDVLNCDIPDEAIETAAGSEAAANYTLGACTGLSVCPG